MRTSDIKKAYVKIVEIFKNGANNIHQRIGDKLDKDRLYETRWVWYHTILAIEIMFTNILLIAILVALLIK